MSTRITDERRAATDHPIHDLLAARYSPRAFASTPVPRATLLSLFEAARWAPSSRNAQPWRFIVATRDDAEAYANLLSVLNESNRRWAGNAPVLMLTVAEVQPPERDRPNSKALHDLGQAVAHLTVEAMARGLYLRQMGGILPERGASLYRVPPGYEVVTGLALGYPAEPEALPDDLAERERAPRQRRPLDETFFGGAFGTPSPLLDDNA